MAGEERVKRLAVLIDADNASPKIADGLFDDQWHYVDKDISLMSDVNRTALDTAALACATAG